MCDKRQPVWWGFDVWRRRVVGQVRGRVLEVGCGWGHNFSHYAPEARVAAFDVDASRLRQAQQRAAKTSGQVRVLAADAQRLPFASGSFAAVVGTLVFCSIPNPQHALREIRRVLAPGGTVHLLEHVRSHHAWLGRLQDDWAPGWLALTGGCNLNRDTAATVRAAGFDVTARTAYAGLLAHLVARPAVSPLDKTG